MSAPEKAPEAPAKAEAPVVTEPVKAPAPVKEEPPVKEEVPAKAEPKAPAKSEKKPADIEPPKDRKALEALVEKQGADAAVQALSKVKVVDLRALAREFNGEFGIAGREIRNANKKVLIEEFTKFFKK